MMIFATLIIAVLCGMGLGSGGLFIVYLTLIAGYDQLVAQGLNLYFFIFSTASALMIHLKNSNLPMKRLFTVCSVGSLGCVAGAALAQSMDKELLRVIFAILLILSGTVSFLQQNTATDKP